MRCFKEDLGSKLDIVYEGEGENIAREFYIPVLRDSHNYRRVSGYFSIDSIVVVATGLAGLIRNGGRMRLVMGAHDVGEELSQAYLLSREKAHNLLSRIGHEIAEGLTYLEDFMSRKRLEAVAWMLASGTLEIRVAIPRKTFLGRGNGIFHQKELLFTDGDGCTVAATGSANETRSAYERNGENLTIHMSWKDGSSEYISRYENNFEALWNDELPDYCVFPLPEAIESRLKERFYPEMAPDSDPLEPAPETGATGVDKSACVTLVSAARLIKELGSIEGFTHLGLGPVRLYPYQIFAVDFASRRFPHRVLFADEVGLGKTLEAGATIKRLIDTGEINRVLVLAPKNITQQWLDELWSHFGLKFYSLESNPRRFVSAEGEEVPCAGGNPFDRAGFDRVVVSWHYARGSRRRDSDLLTTSKFFDLVVIDEAHAARIRREPGGKTRETMLYRLAQELSVRSPHMLLLTATPVQLRIEEAHDLLRIMGLGGPWVYSENFKRYYDLIISGIESASDYDIVFGLNLASWVARHYLTETELGAVLDRIFGEQKTSSAIRRSFRNDVGFEQMTRDFRKEDPEKLRELLLALSPIHWFMIRNTRKKLETSGFTFPFRLIKEVPVELNGDHRSLLERLDSYLRNQYGRYERLLSADNRGVIGFVRSIYHQRFVSSFTASYLTLKHREEFLTALLEGNKEALLREADKVLEEEDADNDEEDIVEAMEELLKGEGQRLLRNELEDVRQLIDDLLPYSPDTLRSDDPKLSKVLNTVDELLSGDHRVVIFSKYTDTVSAVVRFLTRHSNYLTKADVGVYTGEGGRLFDPETQQYAGRNKEDVRIALDEGKIRVLVCSEAAREGLNLQSADCLINVDMPWNPARVEQRIGRIDRLGQKASSINVINIWYPDTIEALMYRALFERKELYELVVGPAQEIISEQMRKALDMDMEGERLRNFVRETMNKVDVVKRDVRNNSVGIAGQSWEGSITEDDRVIELVADFVSKASAALGMKIVTDGESLILSDEASVLPEDLKDRLPMELKQGRPKAVTPSNPVVRWLADSVLANAGRQEPDATISVYVLKDHRRTGRVYVIDSEGSVPEQCSGNNVATLLEKLLNSGGT